MLLCILGFSASGKDTVTKGVINKFNFTKITQHTSRPRRTSEINGVDYHFVSMQDFEASITSQEFISYREFNTISGMWYYGIKKESINLNEKEILIIDIEGLIELKNNIECKDIISIFIDVDYELRLERVKNRRDVDLNEFQRRTKDDESRKKFILQECDVVVKNIHLDSCLLEIQRIIEK